MIIPNLDFGGAQISFSKLNHELAKHFQVFTIVFNTFDGVDVPLASKLIDLEIPAGNNWISKAIYFYKRIVKIKSIKRKLDISSAVSFLEGANYVNILSKVNDRVIISVRGSKSNDENINGVLGAIRKRLFIPFLYNRCDAIVTVNESIKDELINDFNISTPCITIPNFYSIEELNKRAQEDIDEREKHLFESQSFKILAVGRLAIEKGYHHFLKVIALLKPQYLVQLIIVGDGAYKTSLIEKCTEFGISYTINDSVNSIAQSDVCFLGYKSNPIKYARFANIFVLPSSAEGFPNAMFEYMSQGVPVVGTDCDGIRELLSDGLKSYGSILPIFDSPMAYTDWADYIKVLIDNPSKLRKLSQAGKVRVEMFDREHSIKKWIMLTLPS